MNDIKRMERLLFQEAWNLRNASFELLKINGKFGSKKEENFKRVRELQKKQDEVWKKKVFFEKYIKEMEKLNDRED